MKVTITKKDCFHEDGTQREYASGWSCPLHTVMEEYYPNKEFMVGGNLVYFAGDYTHVLHYDHHAWNSSIMKDLIDEKIQSVELELTTKS